MFGITGILDDVLGDEVKPKKRSHLKTALELHENDDRDKCKSLDFLQLEDAILVLLARGLEKDLRSLIRGFVNIGELRFQNFLTIWNEQNFHTIFFQKSSYKMVRVTTLISYFRVLSMLDNAEVLKVVAVLYCLYCLFNVQVCLPKVRIPITMEKFEYFKDLSDHSLQTGQYDVYYCFRKMQTLQAFDFVVKESIGLPYFSIRFGKSIFKELEINNPASAPEEDKPILEKVGVANEDLDYYKGILDSYHAHRMDLALKRDTFSISYSSQKFYDNLVASMEKFDKWKTINPGQSLDENADIDDINFSDDELHEILSHKQERCDDSDDEDFVPPSKEEVVSKPKKLTRRQEIISRAFQTQVEASVHKTKKTVCFDEESITTKDSDVSDNDSVRRSKKSRTKMVSIRH
ncbi:DgyrCDS2094 [Dimorphilus gyrociliatus]|uniref:DgyrCDS2094 n=1 Tax=Dimorphilus gyrociliatus TaxID=2664684 RepID=A0A7I8VC13_9ANNE|nr:DgyrCDS2094 [Dimorphilus gyrociliatus]